MGSPEFSTLSLLAEGGLTGAPPHSTLDPIFALLIGFSAAALRIKREENEKLGLERTAARSGTVDREPVRQSGSEGEVGWLALWEVGRRRAGMEWGRVRRRFGA